MNTVEGFGSFALLLAHLHARKQSLKALTMKGEIANRQFWKQL